MKLATKSKIMRVIGAVLAVNGVVQVIYGLTKTVPSYAMAALGALALCAGITLIRRPIPEAGL